MRKPNINAKLLALVLSGACMSLSASAQTLKVQGHVQDKSGEPVVFATVTVPGTKTAT